MTWLPSISKKMFKFIFKNHFFLVHIDSFLFIYLLFLFLFLKKPSFFQILVESMYLMTNYLDMEEKLASTQTRIENLSAKNPSLKGSMKKMAAESVEMGKQLKTAQANLIIEKNLSAQNDDHLEKVKKEVEEVVKNFKASGEYLDRMMVEYADGFELLQKYLVKHHPDLNFALLDIEKEMVTTEAALVSAVAVNTIVEVRSVEGNAGSTVPVTSDANVE